jgi:chorismate synthase
MLSSAQVAYRPSHADATYDMKYGVRAIAVRWTRCAFPWSCANE